MTLEWLLEVTAAGTKATYATLVSALELITVTWREDVYCVCYKFTMTKNKIKTALPCICVNDYRKL